jgi:hypothetical protein
MRFAHEPAALRRAPLAKEGAMRANRWVFLGLVLAGLVTAETAVAQQGPPVGLQKQRAPGVPLAPKPAEIYNDAARERQGSDVDHAPRQIDARQERAAERGAERDLPMPKPVPPIIAR